MEGGTKGEKRNQLLASGFASVATKPQNLDDTGGRRKKYMYLSLGHHSRKRIAFFFFLFLLLFYTSFWIMWKKRWLEICKYSAVIYGNQKYYSRLHLSYTLAKKASFQNISNTEELRQKGSDSDKKSKAVLYKETYLIRLQSRYQSIVKGLLYNASSLYLVFKTRRAAFCLTQGPER